MNIELRDIYLSFKDQKLFEGFSFRINSGEKVWLRAPSGSGKSTLMKMIFGFQQPNKGEVFIDGKEMNANSINAIRSKMGYVAQNIPLPKLKVDRFLEELIQFESNRNLGISKVDVLEALQKFDLNQDIINKNTEELSGGERQRFAFALLTLLNRKIWLLDEVTNGLDYKNAEFILNKVDKINATVIIVSHDEIWKKLNLKKIQINE